MVSATASRPDPGEPGAGIPVGTTAAAVPASRWRARARTLLGNGVRPISLRARITLAFALGALALSSVLAVVTFGLTRSTLLRQREANVLRQAYLNASVLGPRLTSANPAVDELLQSLQTPTGANPLVFYRGRWTAQNVQFGDAQLPVALTNRVRVDKTAARMRSSIEGVGPVLAVGVPLPDVDGYYFEIVSLQETASTLRSIGVSLLGASILTTGLGVALGVYASRRMVRPLAQAASAASAFASGRLDTRLEVPDDPDLSVLTTAFNDMAATLQGRLERDARFTSDVSHELRSPLMTLSASTAVLQSNRADMPDRAVAALDLLADDVQRFQGMVEDLLEMSRYDAGGIRLAREEVMAAELVRQAVAISGHHDVVIEVSPLAEGIVIEADKRRLARVMQNLLDNASIHGAGEQGSGPIEVLVEPGADDNGVEQVCIAVQDHGLGVPAGERARVFERFARGTNAGRRARSEGAGLGLALVEESVRLHGGRVFVEDRLDGADGARFVVQLPTVAL